MGEARRLQLLPRQRQHARPRRILKRQLPALGGLDGIAGPIDREIGNDAQRRQVFHRLMGRAVLAQPDRVMRHHVDDALLHQRREADRGAAVVGEDQEGAAIGNDAAMQRHAVHRRRHAMFADAVIDVTAAVVGRVQRLEVLRLRVVRAGQVGRAAHRFRHRGVDHVERVLRGIAGGERGRRLGQILLVGLRWRRRTLPAACPRRGAGTPPSAARHPAPVSRLRGRQRRGLRPRASRPAGPWERRRARAASPAPRGRRRFPPDPAASHARTRCRPWSGRRSRSPCGRR